MEIKKMNINEIFDLAEQGNPLMQFQIGYMYENGIEIPENKELAYYWYKKSAEQGYFLAQYHLGNMYFYGIAVPKDLKLAYHWFKKSAEQGYSKAQTQLGYMYLKGAGIQQNTELAYYWFKKSAEQNESVAQYNIGLMHLNGNYVSRDVKKAYYWFEKSAENGSPQAQYHLGYLFYNGYGVPKNKKLAFKWFKKSAEQNYWQAQKVLDENNKGKPRYIPQLIMIFTFIFIFALLNFIVNVTSGTLQYYLNIIRQLAFIPVFLYIGFYSKNFSIFFLSIFTFIAFSVPYFISYYSLPIKYKKYIKEKYKKEIKYNEAFKIVRHDLKEILGSNDIFRYAIYIEKKQLDPENVVENANEKINELKNEDDAEGAFNKYIDLIIYLIPSVISHILYIKLGWITNPGYIGLIYWYLLSLLIAYVGWRSREINLFDLLVGD